MHAGEVIADRFRLEAVVGSGGMGTVWRAHDLHAGQPVALKVLRDASPTHLERFLREALLLEEIRHPAVCSYIAHGTLDGGAPFLAMEWLEGEDLAARLRRDPLTPAQAVELVRVVAGVLDALHGRGVVHRDIKPSNLLLVDRDPARVKLLDFGVARLVSGAAGTHTGMMLGTPGYMSPEQARAERQVDGRADLFSLGCVLYECLVGQPPFVADHPIAVLAKILVEEAPRLAHLHPELGAGLDTLVASLLAKEPAGRPPTAQAVLAALAALGPLEGLRRAPTPAARRVLTSGERSLCSVILAGRADTWAQLSSGVTAAPAVDSRAPTHAAAADFRLRQAAPRLRAEVEAAGGALHLVGEGALLVAFSGVGTVTDQVLRAARTALAIRRSTPDLPVALATGRGVITQHWPLGEVIDRAAALLSGVQTPGTLPGTRIDALTAGLLGPRFICEADGPRIRLVGEVPSGPAAARLLLGKAMPFVGRERDLERLVRVVDEALEEPASRVALVVAPPGVGKSRLRDQLLLRLAEERPELALWTARGDPVRHGSPFLLAGQLLRSAMGLAEDGSSSDVREGLVRLAERARLAERERVLPFLGELLGATASEGADPQVLEARLDPSLMFDQLRRAWDDLLTAILAQQPLALVLDDAHWSDRPSLRLLDGALRRASEAPLAVVGFARPAIHEAFPGLWKERGVEETRLRELPRKAAEQLARAGLGEAAQAQVDRLVALSDGNPLHLEELIRAAQQGRDGDLPPTVVAMIQSRLEALPLPLRRVLRAGAIFGSRFTREGVAHLLGEAAGMLEGALADLEAQELVERQRDAAAAATFGFRHALVREAAEAMLTEEDAALGHRLAGEWLEAAGAVDALLIAEQFARGGEKGKAASYLARAADEALIANDLAAVDERAQRGIALGATGAILGELHRAAAEAAFWRSDNDGSWAHASKALPLCERNSESWYRAAVVAAASGVRLARIEDIHILATDLLSPDRAKERPAPFVVAAVRVAWQLFNIGETARGHQLLGRAEEVGKALVDVPRVYAALQVAGATRTQLVGDLEAWVHFEKASVDAFLAVGDVRRACEAQASQGYALNMLGSYGEAIAQLTQAMAQADALGIPLIRSIAEQNLGWALGCAGRMAEGLEHLDHSVAAYRDAHDQRLEGGSWLYVARLLLQAGRAAEATLAADQAERLLRPFPPLLLTALAIRVEERLEHGHVEEAIATAERALRLLADLGVIEEGEAYVRWTAAKAAAAHGQHERSQRLAAEALARVAEQAERIGDPERRRRFVEDIAEHRHLREMVPAAAPPTGAP